MRPAAIALVFLVCTSGARAGEDFDAWLAVLRAEAVAAGISEATLDATLEGLTPDERVIGFDRNQPEFVQTFAEYLTARVSEQKIAAARRLYREHETDLLAIENRFGVGAEFLVAFWGLESSFGRYQGKYSVVRSLATLAFDPRRSAFFRRELLSALRILDEGHVQPAAMVGGWAGAMGQNQFMPSSFLRYAVDFDGDGRKDIWRNRMDVWGSIANYLKLNGWQEGGGWGRPVLLPAGFREDDLKQESVPKGCRALRHLSRELPLSAWRERGIDLGDEADDSIEAALILGGDDPRRSYLAYANFRTILRYNCANKYAVSVGLLADLIHDGAD